LAAHDTVTARWLSSTEEVIPDGVCGGADT
jgi:hypothetical protein